MLLATVDINKLKPVTFVGGDNTYLVDRAAISIRTAARKAGWDINYVSGTDVPAVASATGGGFLGMMDLPELPVIELPSKTSKAEKETLEMVAEHKGQPILVIGKCGSNKLPKRWSGIKGKHITAHHFMTPPFYKAQDAAVAWCQQEASLYGKKLPTRLAKGILAQCGLDYGLLAPEIAKASMLADLEGAEELTAAIVKRTLAPPPADPAALASELQDALATGQKARVTPKLYKCSKVRGDPVFSVLKIAETTIWRWFIVADLLQQGGSAESAASQMGLNPWYVKNALVGPAHMLGWEKCRELCLLFADVQRLAITGTVNPWQVFVARCLAWCPR